MEPGNNKKEFITMEEDEIDVVLKIKQKHSIHFQIKGKKMLSRLLIMLLLFQPRNVLLTVFCASPSCFELIVAPAPKFRSSKVIVH